MRRFSLAFSANKPIPANDVVPAPFIPVHFLGGTPSGSNGASSANGPNGASGANGSGGLTVSHLVVLKLHCGIY